MKEPGASDIEHAAAGLLAAREHSRLELCRKLQNRFGNMELIGGVLDRLQAQNFQSDERYAEHYVSSRSRKGYGPLRIRRDLRSRGIADDLIAVYLDDGDQHWLDLLRWVVGRKFGDQPPNGQKAMAKQARFLEYRGFPPSMIRSYIYRH